MNDKFKKEIDSRYLREAARVLQKVKERSYRMLQVRPGQRLLDVGCGPGVDTVALARLVAPGGTVIGVDADRQMIVDAGEAAHEAGVASSVSHQEADCRRLPFPADHFNGVRAERLFQVLPADIPPSEVLAEMIRVTRPGGTIVLVDTDWAGASVEFPDRELENRLLHFFCEECRPNGIAGRQFYSLVRDSGLELLNIEALPVLMFDFETTPLHEWLTREALKQEIATPEEMDFWNRTLLQATRDNRFLAIVNMILVSARKPN